MTAQILSPLSPDLKLILAPVAEDVAAIDTILRATASLEHPLVRGGVEAIISAGGKRLRPAVLFLAARFNRYDLDRLLPMSAAIELLHTASLVHDDTIDEALLRRGLPTLNSVLDAGTTVLVGDYLFAKAAVLSTLAGVMRATRIFAESLVTISEGELEQHLSSHHLDGSAERYYKRIYAKTAVLFAAAGEIGAVLSDAPEDEVQLLREYGRQLGMAFQVVDDVLDLVATSDKLGKPIGGDLRQGTLTLPIMYYLETASSDEREAVRRIMEGVDRSDELLDRTIGSIVASDALERAYGVAENFAEGAKRSLASFPDVAARQSLLALADFAVHRDF